jgi:hypothetical protein
MSYNMSFLGTSNNIMELVSGVNVATGGIVGLMFLVVLYLVLIASFRSYDTDRVFMISGFITSIVASLFFFAGMVAWWVVMLFVMLLLISLLVYFFTS